MRERSTQLDILRAVAIFMVLWVHTILFKTPTWDFFLVQSGWAGVDLFFVLSGFLISGLLFTEYRQEHRIDFRRFAIRRALKIWPPLWFLTAITLLLRIINHGGRDLAQLISPALHDLVFIQSYLPGTYGHFWSLSVEEFFYLLFPLTLFLLLRLRSANQGNPFRRLPVLFFCLAAFCLTFRLYVSIRHPIFDHQIHFYPAHLRMDELAFGVVISYWYSFYRNTAVAFLKRFRWPLAATAAVLVSPCVLFDGKSFYMHTFGLLSLAVGFGLVVLLSLQVRVPRNTVTQGLALVGRHSYSIYLWHIPMLYVLMRMDFQRWRASTSIYFAASLAVGITMSKLIEKPSIGIRDRMYPARVRPLSLVTSDDAQVGAPNPTLQVRPLASATGT